MSVVEAKPARAASVPTADELIGRAKALAPKLRERAVQAERDRNIPAANRSRNTSTLGLIHTLQPKRWGGYEHDHEVAFDIAIELGKSTCGSSAWCLNYLGDHACILAHFPGGGAARRLEPQQGRLHRHLGGADRQGRGGARRLPAQRPLVVVQRACAIRSGS